MRRVSSLCVDLNQQQILQLVFVHAIVLVNAEFQRQTEVLEEFFIFLPIVFQHVFQGVLDLFLNALGQRFHLPVLLEDFTRDVQIQIVAVDQTADEAEVIRYQILGFVHDEHALAVKLQVPVHNRRCRSCTVFWPG